MANMTYLEPAACSHRSAQIATDLALMLGLYLDTMSQFLSKHEMFHLQMNTLYVLIDIMGATSNAEPTQVLEHCKIYFDRLKQERRENERQTG